MTKRFSFTVAGCPPVSVILAPNTLVFLSEAVSLGHAVLDTSEKRGMTFCYQAKDGVRSATVLLNMAQVDIEIITHEVRHALCWFMSNASGVVVLDLEQEAEEELFGSRLDAGSTYVVTEVERFLKRRLIWRM